MPQTIRRNSRSALIDALHLAPQHAVAFFLVSAPREFDSQARLTSDAARGFRQAAQDGECWSIQNTERVFRSHIETAFVTSVPH
jgi:hypothetical protein